MEITWYLRNRQDFGDGYNIDTPPHATPEEVAHVLAQAAAKAQITDHAVGIWHDGTLIAAAEHDIRLGSLVRIIPAHRHLISLPWRNWA